MSTGLDPDHVGGRTPSSFSRVTGVIAAWIPPSSIQPIDREDTYAAAIGQDRQPFSWRQFDTPQRLAQSNNSRRSDTRKNSRATERGIVDRVRTGQRAGMGRGSLRALRHAAGFDDDDGLDTRRRARAADMNLRASLMDST